MLFSVIIPAYNAEKYIAETLSSIFSQKTKYDFEVIVINDGSSDSTERELISASEKYPRLIYKTISNSGPSLARNEGMKLAGGEYIIFCDSDDYFADGAFEKIMDDVLASKPDFYIFGFEIADEKGRHEKYYFEKAVFDNKGFAENMHLPYVKNMLNQVWGKVFRKDIIIRENISFIPHKWGEDRLFVLDYAKYAEKIVFTDECFYEYVQMKGSLISSFTADKFEVCTEIDKKVRAFSNSQSIEAKKCFDYMYVKSVISCFTMLCSPKCLYSYSEKRKYIKDALSEKALISKKEYPENSGIAFKFLAMIIKSKSPFLIMLFSYSVYFASEKMSLLFRHSKHKMNASGK